MNRPTLPVATAIILMFLYLPPFFHATGSVMLLTATLGFYISKTHSMRAVSTLKSRVKEMERSRDDAIDERDRTRHILAAQSDDTRWTINVLTSSKDRTVAEAAEARSVAKADAKKQIAAKEKELQRI